MPEKDNERRSDKKTGKYQSKFISIIYNQKNDSPKYFQVKKSQVLIFIIGLPTITLVAMTLGGIGLIHTSPFHLIENYRQNSMARDAVAKTNILLKKIEASEVEKLELNKKLIETEEKLKTLSVPPETNVNKPTSIVKASSTVSNSPGFASLSLFKAVQGQKDLSKIPTISLSGFKVVGNRDNTNFQFNIVPAAGVDGKLAGHIIVLMKNELTIQAYPQQVLSGNDIQINFSSGESFSSQHFRPVDASFLKPRKPGNYTFAIFIFAKNGDLIHYESVILPVKF